jgi:hypothetical protein
LVDVHTRKARSKKKKNRDLCVSFSALCGKKNSG